MIYIFVSVHICFGWLVSVMVTVVWATISQRKHERRRTVSLGLLFLDVTAIQSINVFDVAATKYSTDKRMALCYLSGWFYIDI